MLLLSVIAIALHCSLLQLSAAQPLKLIVLVSTNSSDDATTPLWDRGEEIVPGALLAAQEVNNYMDGFTVEVAPVLVESCNVNDAILKVVRELVYRDTPVLGVAGLSCENVKSAISSLVGRNEVGIIQLFGATLLSPTIHQAKDISHQFSVLPNLDTHIEALVELMAQLNWKKIGIVIGASESSAAADAFQETVTKQSFQIEVDLRIQFLVDQIEDSLLKLTSSTTKIIVAFLSPVEASELLCKAFNTSMTWPEYAWILPELTVNEMDHCNDGNTNILKAMENVIFFRPKFVPSNANTATLVSKQTYQSYVQKLASFSNNSFNPFANLVYDMVWGLSLALNASLQQGNVTLPTNFIGSMNQDITERMEDKLLQMNFSGASGDFKFLPDRQLERTVEMFQVQNQSLVLIGVKCTACNTTFTGLINQPIPGDTLKVMYELIPIPVMATLTALTFLCVLFLTVELVLFICYWNEPEIQASSRLLSLCIFVGCYLILIGSLAHTISSGLTSGPSVCITISVAATIGMDLILATVLAKTLRIAYIFARFRKTGKMWSDTHLLGMILVIVAGKVIILIVWNTVDFYQIVDVMELKTVSGGVPHYNVYQACHSEQLGVWLFLEFAYSIVIGIALSVLAYKTRKIKRANYKDTKKINIFIVFLFGWCIVFLAFWGIFRFIGARDASTILASVGFPAVPLLCPVFLIIPKIVPGIKRSLSSRTPDSVLFSRHTQISVISNSSTI